MNIRRSLIAGFLACISLAFTTVGCGGSDDAASTADSVAIDTGVVIDSVEATPQATPLKEGRFSNARIKVNYFGSFREAFNDSNRYQYAHAERLGIDPVYSIKDCYHTKRPIVKIESNELYEVDKLTHSLPFLVPEAATLLEDIGRNFIDSLAKRGADGYRVKVTSLLRTPSTVKRLRRVNVNASDSSTHQFGTTFDLSYNHFHCLDSTRTINGNDLKGLLGEVLRDLRNQGRCLVKYEYKTACFHITAIR